MKELDTFYGTEDLYNLLEIIAVDANNRRVLNPGEFYFLSAPNVVGAQTVRKDVTTAPINLYLVGKPERGWFMQKIMGMAIGNGRAVVRGVRI